MQRMYVITANEGMYLTQNSNDIPDEERDYVTEISSADPNVYELWRDATEEEYQEWSLRTTNEEL